MSRANEYGTALSQALPWFHAIDALADAVRALLDRQGSEAELARCWYNYHETARAVMGESENTPPESRGAAYPGLSDLRYRG
jgi:hypothetical protein